MTVIDYIVLAVYILMVVLVGFVMQWRAKHGIEAYFLGQRSLPWWALGASGMASNLDVTGTMINTAFIFALGISGFFIEIRGGVVLVMGFLMVFMGKWNRRSQVMTLAEWMHFRFGSGKEGNLARLIAAVTSLITTTAMVTYFAVGSGKFIGEFLGIPDFWGMPSQFWASSLMIVLAMIYTVASGLYGVVWTDVFQGFLIFGVIVYICFISVTQYALPESFSVSVPMRDATFQTIETTRDAWTNIVPNWRLDMPEGSEYSIYNLFGIAILFYFFRTVTEGCGGTQGYMLQRYLAARSDRDAGLLSLLWTTLLAFRWPFIAAVAIIAIAKGGGNTVEDPEMVLPYVINSIIPIGIKGLVVAGLMAAAMSTFDSTVNAGASYWVRDIYQAFINPQADNKQLLRHSRWASVVIVLTGLFCSLLIRNINDIWGWLTMSIGGGLLIPLLIRWYWWRLNGYGFAIGMGAGMIAALVQKMFFGGIPEYAAFLFSASISFIFLVWGTYKTTPTERPVLENFYKVTRPCGFWRPIREGLSTRFVQELDAENKRDFVALLCAVPWQLVLFLMLMAAVMRRWDNFSILFVLFALFSCGLYFFWYRYLSSEVKAD